MLNAATKWMTKNSVAANLLMFLFIVGGLVLANNVRQEVFPEIEMDTVNVQVTYQGASPSEVEQGILLAVEDAVKDVAGIKRITSEASEGSGRVSIELLSKDNRASVLLNIKNSVDAIRSFPDEIETPVVSLQVLKRKIVSLIVYGDQSESNLRELAETVRIELQGRKDISLVELAAVKALEISIEIPQSTLRAYNLTLDTVAQIIRNNALDLAGGSVKTNAGEVLIRTQDRKDQGSDFANIPIVANANGSYVRLGDLAQIKDAFEEQDIEFYYNSKPAIRMEIYSIGSETPESISQSVKSYIQEKSQRLPQGTELAIFDDQSEAFAARMEMLVKNAALGLILVLVILALFLDPKLAFWVMLGLPVSILGSFLFFGTLGATLNMVSMFAFIITLGVVVDDALIIGESIHHERAKGMSNLDAAIKGTKAMSGPILFAVLTNIAAFMPLFFIPGTMGDIMSQIPAVVVAVLTVSLIECLLILPAHMAHSKESTGVWKTLGRPQKHISKWLTEFTEQRFSPVVKFAIKHRYSTIASGVFILILSIGMVRGGYILFNIMPKIDSDIISVQATLPYGSPLSDSKHVHAILVESAQKTIEQYGGNKIVRGVFSTIGANVSQQNVTAASGGHEVGVIISLIDGSERDFSGTQFAKSWREMTGEIAGLEKITFSGERGFGGAGAEIQVELIHQSDQVAQEAAAKLAAILSGYDGIIDINDGFERGKPQLDLALTPQARSLGVTSNELARQVRAAFFGSEVLRQQRGRNEVKVMVRLPLSERSTLDTVSNMTVQTADGGEFPLGQAATVKMGYAFTNIKRTGGSRVVPVTAGIDDSRANLTIVMAEIKDKILPALLQQYPGLSYSFEGQNNDRQESMQAMAQGMMAALLAIYALLAIPFKSYSQPLIVMLSIPFGVVGAILGHMLMGFDLSLPSIIGIIALSGVVINDSLVLVVTANQFRDEEKLPAANAAVKASIRRLRPILLTTLTTFFGLVPMLMETSMQARFLIPMAISIAFGLLFATVIILFIVPSVYMVLEDIKIKLKFNPSARLTPTNEGA